MFTLRFVQHDQSEVVVTAPRYDVNRTLWNQDGQVFYVTAHKDISSAAGTTFELKVKDNRLTSDQMTPFSHCYVTHDGNKHVEKINPTTIPNDHPRNEGGCVDLPENKEAGGA